MAKTRLKAPPGTSEANWSGSPKPYPVGLDGTVEVDDEAVAPLLDRGGFTEVKEEVEVPSAGTVKLVHTSGAHVSGTANDQPFDSDDKGVVVVPAEAEAVLARHGFLPFVEPDQGSLSEPSEELVRAADQENEEHVQE